MPMHRAVAAYQNLSFTICLIPFVSSPVEVQPPGLCRSPGGGELLRRFSPLKAAKNIAQPCRIKPWRFAKLSKPAGAAEHSGTEYSSILQAEVSFGSSLGRCTQNPRFPGVTRAAVDAHAGADLLLRSRALYTASANAEWFLHSSQVDGGDYSCYVLSKEHDFQGKDQQELLSAIPHPGTPRQGAGAIRRTLVLSAAR